MKVKNSLRLKVCNGPSCEAWDSRIVLAKLLKINKFKEPYGFNIKSSDCMEQCGGGVTIETSLIKGCIKIRSPREVLKFVNTLNPYQEKNSRK